MRQHTKDPHGDLVPTRGEERDSPAIQNLIEQLDRDLEETRRQASKAQ